MSEERKARAEELTKIESLRLTICDLQRDNSILKMQVLLRDIRIRLQLKSDEKMTLQGDQVIIEKVGESNGCGS